MFKKIIIFVLSFILISCLCPTTVRAEDPLLSITTTDPSSPFIFTSSTSNDNTTIDGLTINYDSSNSRFTITIANGKTVNLKQYFSYDNTIDCNTNLLINGNGNLIVTKVPNAAPNDDYYSSRAFSVNGTLQIGDSNTSPAVTTTVEYDNRANADTFSYDNFYAYQIKLINSTINIYTNQTAFYIDGPYNDDALYIDHSKVNIEHYCKVASEAQEYIFEVVCKYDAERFADVTIKNDSELHINSDYESCVVADGNVMVLSESGLYVEDSLIDASFKCGDLGLIRAFNSNSPSPNSATEKVGHVTFKNSRVIYSNEGTNCDNVSYGPMVINATDEISFIDTVFDIKTFGTVFGTNNLNITNSSEEYGGIIQNDSESLNKYFLLGYYLNDVYYELTDGYWDGTPLPPPTINIDYPKNNQILTSKKVGGVLNPQPLINDTTLNGDINEYRFVKDTSNNDDVQVNYLEITRKYKVSLNLDGGNCSVSKILANKGAAIGALPTPTKDGYSFVKWVDGSDNTVTGSTLVTDDMTIKAIWQSNGSSGGNSSSNNISSGHIVLNTSVE